MGFGWGLKREDAEGMKRKGLKRGGRGKGWKTRKNSVVGNESGYNGPDVYRVGRRRCGP